MGAMRRGLLAPVLALLAASCTAGQRPDYAAGNIWVDDAKELLAALQPANAGRRIELAAGDYAVDRPLTVPDGTTLAGAGVMTFDADGLPAGFESGTASTLRVTAAFDGNVLALGNGSRLERLRVLDLDTRASAPAQRRGNVVYVASRAPADAVEASIVECELANPNRVGFTDDGPIGHGVAALTLNPGFDAGPAAHEGAQIDVQLLRSIVRTDSGAVIFANNFAARGRVAVLLVANRFHGRLIATGGTSRLDAVRDAVTQIESSDNLYLVSGYERQGWLIMGASSSPHYDDLPGNGAARNLLRLESRDDRIEGFSVGIQAAAARRVGVGSQPLNGNRLELTLERTRLRTDGAAAADLQLWGAWSEIAQAQGPGEFPAGDGNVLRVRAEGLSGSGRRQNAFGNVAGPVKPGNQGVGNRLEIEGRQEAFVESNRDLDPPPPAQSFTDPPVRPGS